MSVTSLLIAWVVVSCAVSPFVGAFLARNLRQRDPRDVVASREFGTGGFGVVSRERAVNPGVVAFPFRKAPPGAVADGRAERSPFDLPGKKRPRFSQPE